MSKLPAMPFYVGDWRKDPGIQSLSYNDRGVWHEMLCLMWESPERGKLIVNGKPMSFDSIARALGLSKQTFEQTLAALMAAGVPSHCPLTGALMNRRMVRDEEIRKVRSAVGRLGGNPLLKQPAKELKESGSLVIQNLTKQVNQIPESETENAFEIRLHGIPFTVAVVIAYGATLNPKVSEKACREFWNFYESIRRTNPSGEIFWVTAGENPSIITNWKAKLPSFGHEKYGPNSKPNPRNTHIASDPSEQGRLIRAHLDRQKAKANHESV